MKSLILKWFIGWCLLVIGLFVLSCGEEPGTDNGTGGVAAVTFQIAPKNFRGLTRAPAMDCDGLGIDTISAMVYDTDNSLLKIGGPWACSLGEGIIEDVPAGLSAKVVIICNHEENGAIYRGESMEIDLEADQVVDAGVIGTTPFAPTLLSPSSGSLIETDSVDLSWNSVADVDGYQVLVSISEGFDDTDIVFDQTVSDPFCTLTSDGNDPGGEATYYWRVHSVDIYGNTSAGSEVWYFTSTLYHPAQSNNPPVVTIESPENRSVYEEGATVSFRGTADDPEDGSLTGVDLVWTSTTDGEIGTGRAFDTSLLSPGVHTITLKATDEKGRSGQASIKLTMMSHTPNTAPVATISAPTDGTVYNAGAPVSFEGSGWDAEDGDLLPDSLLWTIDGVDIAAGVSFTKNDFSLGDHTIALTVTDSLGATDEKTVTITIQSQNAPPTASISQPASGDTYMEGNAVTLLGTGSDVEDSQVDLSWSSSLDGVLGTGSPLALTTLTVGTHEITLTATDSDNATGQASVTIDILANTPPIAAIEEPQNNTAYIAGTNIPLIGSGTDAEDGALDGAALSWFSSLDGPLGKGKNLFGNTLSAGTHEISLTVTDSGGATDTAAVTVVILANDPPTAVIAQPATGMNYTAGTAIQFNGSGTDTEDHDLDASALSWSSSLDGFLGTGSPFFTNSLSPGNHEITLTATDSAGATGTDSIVILITGQPQNTPPTAYISAPATQSSYMAGTLVTFTGSASDVEDGTLASSALSWYSSINGNLGTGSQVATGNLSTGTHEITLTARDSKGATGTDSITIVMYSQENTPPTAYISAPENRSTYGAGSSISFLGSGTDYEDGQLPGTSLSWRSSIDGELYTGAEFSKALSQGTHTITLIATDSQGVTGRDEVSITVNALQSVDMSGNWLYDISNGQAEGDWPSCEPQQDVKEGTLTIEQKGQEFTMNMDNGYTYKGTVDGLNYTGSFTEQQQEHITVTSIVSFTAGRSSARGSAVIKLTYDDGEVSYYCEWSSDIDIY